MKIKCVELFIITVKVIFILIEIPTRKGSNYMTIFFPSFLYKDEISVCVSLIS